MVECISRGAWVTQLCRVAFFRRHDHLQWFFFSHVTTQFIDNSSILVIDAISEATMRLPISWERSVYRRCLELISQRLGRWLKISCETRKENKVNDLCDAYFDIVVNNYFCFFLIFFYLIYVFGRDTCDNVWISVDIRNTCSLIKQK